MSVKQLDSPSTPQSALRRLVFISHANPEENDFARWLGAQLASAGYEVWSDVIKLIGGEVFWDNIEDAIRNHAAKVVLAVSRVSNTKNGVLDEAAVAIGVERSQNIPNFVVPIRLDDIDFGDFRANITRKNAIDFSKSWAAGLDLLLQVLERDGVPKGAVGPNDVKAWCDARFDPSQAVRAEPEELVSNWLPIERLPPFISLYSLGVEASKVGGVMSGTKLPWFPYYRLVGTFGSEVDLREDLPPELDIKLEYRIPTETFLKGKPPELPGMESRVARNHVTSLIRQAWDRTLAERGLSSFSMASKTLTWFFTKGQIADDKTTFVDRNGKQRRRVVVGRSEKRNVNWHLGYQARPMLGWPRRVALRATILFSEDGKTPLASVDKMHRLRRGFCRSWWNPHWRDLMLAYVAWLAEGGTHVVLNAGAGAEIKLRAQPMTLQSPVSFSDPATKGAPAVAAVVEEEPEEESPPEDIDDDPDDLGPDDEWDGEEVDDERE